MHSNVTIKNVSWPHFSWPTLYMNVPHTRMGVLDSVVPQYVTVCHLRDNSLLSNMFGQWLKTFFSDSDKRQLASLLHL